MHLQLAATVPTASKMQQVQMSSCTDAPAPLDAVRTAAAALLPLLLVLVLVLLALLPPPLLLLLLLTLLLPACCWCCRPAVSHHSLLMLALLCCCCELLHIFAQHQVALDLLAPYKPGKAVTKPRGQHRSQAVRCRHIAVQCCPMHAWHNNNNNKARSDLRVQFAVY